MGWELQLHVDCSTPKFLLDDSSCGNMQDYKGRPNSGFMIVIEEESNSEINRDVAANVNRTGEVHSTVEDEMLCAHRYSLLRN